MGKKKNMQDIKIKSDNPEDQEGQHSFLKKKRWNKISDEIRRKVRS